jgi:ribosomal protein S11
MVFFNNLYSTNNTITENYRLKRLKNISNILQNKVCILNIRSTLNNVYVTFTTSFGKVIFISSGGSSRINSSKRNTTYNLEVILNMLLGKLMTIDIKNLLLKLDILSMKRKKTIIKVLQNFQIKVLAVQLGIYKAFNGIRSCKRRRI